MQWKDFIAGLDFTRIQVRAMHGKEMNKEADLRNDPALNWLRDLVAGIPVVEPSAPPPPKTELDDMFAILPPEEKPPLPVGTLKVSRPDGEGTMAILPREEPFIPKKPVLEDATEETVGHG